jgi:hypothetical protein
VKDDLKNVKYWNKLDDPNFPDKEIISITIDNKIRSKYNFNSNNLYLELFIGYKFISYGSVSTIYDLSIEDLNETLKKQGYKVIEFPEGMGNSSLLFKQLIEDGYTIIPLNSRCYI